MTSFYTHISLARTCLSISWMLQAPFIMVPFTRRCTRHNCLAFLLRERLGKWTYQRSLYVGWNNHKGYDLEGLCQYKSFDSLRLKRIVQFSSLVMKKRRYFLRYTLTILILHVMTYMELHKGNTPDEGISKHLGLQYKWKGIPLC